MRILHIGSEYYPCLGGASAYLTGLSEGLARRGHSVTVFTIRQSPSSAPADRDAPSHCEVVNKVAIKRFNANRGLIQLMNWLFRIRGAYSLLKSVFGRERLEILAQDPIYPRLILETLSFNADLVVVMNWAGALAYEIYLARTIKRFPLIGIPLLHTEERWSRSALFPRMFSKCDSVLVNTEHEKAFVEIRLAKPLSVHVVGPGVDPSKFLNKDGAAIRDRYGIGNAPVVGYLGRISPTKGVVKLLEAMRLVWKSHQNAYLILAGELAFREGAEQTREWERILAGLPDSEKAHIVRIQKFSDHEKPSILDSFDVFAMPSVGESFGISYLEAWMCRKPVVGSRIGATQCVIHHETDGLLIDPSDPRAIADVLMALLSCPERRKVMGERGYQKTLNLYTWEKRIDEVEKIYASVLAKGDRQRMLVPERMQK